MSPAGSSPRLRPLPPGGRAAATAARASCQQQRGRPALRSQLDEIGGDHDRPPRQPVAEHAADEDERGLRDPLRGEDEADIRGRAGQVEDCERERDEGHAAAEQRDRLADEEEAELALVKCAERRCSHRAANDTARRALVTAPLRGRVDLVGGLGRAAPIVHAAGGRTRVDSRAGEQARGDGGARAALADRHDRSVAEAVEAVA